MFSDLITALLQELRYVYAVGYIVTIHRRWFKLFHAISTFMKFSYIPPLALSSLFFLSFNGVVSIYFFPRVYFTRD